MIRPATLQDLDAMVSMARDFYKVTPWSHLIDMDDKSVEYMMIHFMESGFMAVSEDDGMVNGMFAGGMQASPFNVGVLVAMEAFWWMKPEARSSSAGLKLKKEFENWALENGAEVITMVAVDGESCKSVQKLYARNGYQCMEATWMKGI